jgi:hypothetical protein
MEKKMVYRLSIHLAQTTLIDRNDMLLPKVVHGKDLSYDHRLSKKSRSQRNFSSPNTIPSERNTIITNKDTIEKSNNDGEVGKVGEFGYSEVGQCAKEIYPIVGISCVGHEKQFLALLTVLEEDTVMRFWLLHLNVVRKVVGS